MRKKNPSVGKKNFFFASIWRKKMNDKRNLICGNVMLLSQSCDETSLSIFLQRFRFEGKKKFDLGIAD